MNNKYLEKIASSVDDDVNYAIGTTPAQRLSSNLYSISENLKERGYDSDFGKVVGSSYDAADKKNILLKYLGGTAVGGAVGGLVGRSLLGAGVGAAIGGLAGSMHSTYDHWENKLPAKLKEQIESGYYSKQ